MHMWNRWCLTIKDFKLDDTNDLDFNSDIGNFQLVDGVDELQQRLFLMMNINLGELPWNVDFGLDLNEIRVNAGNAARIQQMISDYLADNLGEQFESAKVTNIAEDRQSRIAYINVDVDLNINGNVTSIEAQFGGELDATDG